METCMSENTAKELLDKPVQLSVRFETELFERLKKSAKGSLRSVSAEINYRVRQSYDSASEPA
jgi:hypothetical protein